MNILIFFLLQFTNSFLLKSSNKYMIVHKITNDECGQAKIKDQYFSKARQFSDIRNGTCHSCGYDKFIRKEIHTFPFIGKLVIMKFKKKELCDNYLLCEL